MRVDSQTLISITQERPVGILISPVNTQDCNVVIESTAGTYRLLMCVQDEVNTVSWCNSGNGSIFEPCSANLDMLLRNQISNASMEMSTYSNEYLRQTDNVNSWMAGLRLVSTTLHLPVSVGSDYDAKFTAAAIEHNLNAVSRDYDTVANSILNNKEVLFLLTKDIVNRSQMKLTIVELITRGLVKRLKRNNLYRSHTIYGYN
jgi:hypothetical protein